MKNGKERDITEDRKLLKTYMRGSAFPLGTFNELLSS